MPISSAASDRGPLRPSTIFRIAVLNSSIYAIFCSQSVGCRRTLISHRVEDLEKKLLVSGNKNESKLLPSSPVPMSTSPVPVTASTVLVKLSTYDGKTNWEVPKTQFSIILEANG
ncbi:hypothetical protein TNCV_3462831 [Trichonephila clavipes]|nr:hypothetical protein TNCV_3462831 [Trichonephila clavipes]